MKIQESGENYLETILVLSRRNGSVRSIDIANALGFSKPSISFAMKHFRENGYITVDNSGYIELTRKGQEIAETVYERHALLSKCLIALGVSEKTARQDACRIEHVLSQETFNVIKSHASLHGIVGQPKNDNSAPSS